MEPRLTKLNKVRTVAFDVYGTILISGSGDIGTLLKNDSEGTMRSCFKTAGLVLWARNRHNPVKLSNRFQTHLKAAWNRRKAEGIEYPEVEIREVWKALLDQLVSENLLGGSPSPATIETLALAYECSVNPVWPMPGVHRTLFNLRKSGLPLGIVSNAQFYTPLILEEFKEPEKLIHYFDPELCLWSYREREAKPSHCLFTKLAGRLRDRNIEPEETLYIGNDMRNDILPAKEAGFQTALFAGDQRSLRMRQEDPLCQGVAPNLVLTSLDQLPACL